MEKEVAVLKLIYKNKQISTFFAGDPDSTPEYTIDLLAEALVKVSELNGINLYIGRNEPIALASDEKPDNYDAIHNVKHYKLEGLNVESIDVVKATLGSEGFCSFCSGNVMKYMMRFKHKNGIEDLKKAQKYLGWLIENYGGEKNVRD